MAKLKKKTEETKTLQDVGQELAQVIPAKNSYDPLRKEFSALANEWIAENESLPETTVETPLGVTSEQVLREMPDYEVVASEEGDDEIVWRLRQSPSSVPYRYYDADTNMVVERGVTKGRKSLNTEELLEDHPEYEEYMVETYRVDGDTVAQIIAEVPELADHFQLISRTLDMEQVNDAAEENKAITTHVEDCTYRGPSTARIGLKKPTPEEGGE